LAAVVLCILIASPVPPARADTFVIGVEDTEYLPHYAVENGDYRGFGREVLDAFFAARGDTIIYRPLPVERLYRTFLTGEVDFKYPDNPDWKAKLKKDHTVRYSVTVVDVVDGVSVPPRALARGTDSIRSLATVRGFTPGAWQSRIDLGRVVLRESDSFRGVVEQAIIGRVDGAFANIDVVQHMLNEVLNKPGTLVFDPDLPFERSRYHLSTLKHAAVLADFDAWLRREAAFLTVLKRKFRIGIDQREGDGG